MLVRREQWIHFLKVAKQIDWRVLLYVKDVYLVCNGKISFCFKIFSIKIYHEANHMSQLNSVHN